MRKKPIHTMLTGIILSATLFAAPIPFAGVPDAHFWQEYREFHPIEPGGAGNDVRAILVDRDNRVWAATGGGLYRMDGAEWTRVAGITPGPVYDLAKDEDGTLWAGAWNGLYRITDGAAEKIGAIDQTVSALGAGPDGLLALGPDGAWTHAGGAWRAIERKWSGDVRDIRFDKDGNAWIATGVGLYRMGPAGGRHFHRMDELYSSEANALAEAPDGRLWIAETGGVDIYENGVRVDTLTAEDGLPNFDARAAAFGPDGRAWIGTALGVARYDGETWSLRHSRRWLPSDEVRDIAFDGNGAAWIATANGAAAIKRRAMTLQDKAGHYYEICMKRHVRAPWIVEKCRFPDPNDLSVFEPLDDDNDGSYTAFYMVMELLRHAVTGDPTARERADKAMDFLELLHTVTGTDHFVARTVIPATWTRMADPNRTYTEAEKADIRRRDPRYKPVETRWRHSKDGNWLWKGDTSSDEITGHMFGYLFYYDLSHDEARRERVRRLTARMMDGIIENGYALKDIDGTHTRWGVWSPEKLLGDPDWRVEAPINAFEILSFLKAAHHITGNERYQTEYDRLIKDHGYLELARRPKSYGRSERTHIDDELLAFAAPALLLYEKNPERRAAYWEGVTWAYRHVENEQNAFWNFLYGWLGIENFHLDGTLFFLRDQPLDLRQWRVDNSAREDVEPVRRPMLEPLQLNRMIPPSERGVMRWDKNPWPAVSGDFNDTEGRLESSGVFWLMPYWLGRHAGFIDPPSEGWIDE